MTLRYYPLIYYRESLICTNSVSFRYVVTKNSGLFIKKQKGIPRYTLGLMARNRPPFDTEAYMYIYNYYHRST